MSFADWNRWSILRCLDLPITLSTNGRKLKDFPLFLSAVYPFEFELANNRIMIIIITVVMGPSAYSYRYARFCRPDYR